MLALATDIVLHGVGEEKPKRYVISGGMGVGKSELLHWVELLALVARKGVSSASFLSRKDYSTPISSMTFAA